ncbi:MAG: rhodanese-like domain-containing protein [Bacteroidia bacterium]|nr:rhodanese-like domain-containing protein [Bacteroidia bacterium]
MVPEISCKEVLAMMQSERPPVLLDVRESLERYTAHIGGIHIPMGEIGMRIGELEKHKNDTVVVYCRSGKRSMGVASFLQSAGFERVYNLRGGLLEWRKDIEPGLAVE